MRRRITGIASVALLIALHTGIDVHGQAPTDGELRRLADAYTQAWNKGDAVSWLAEHLGTGSVPIFIGDDRTDEDAYRAIRGTGISVSIGENLESDYYLKSQREVLAFLKSFL